MVIKILGKGCKNCDKLQAITVQAAEELNLDFTVEKVTDINAIADYGVMRTPALVVDENVVIQGKLPTVNTVKSLLAK